jgi:two-component system, cell cycle sensor histidine kinase and response regulator CckA
MRKSSTILVVDDEETDRLPIVNALRQEGYQILEADSYESALAVAKSHLGISFLVADVALPDGNGCALATAIRQIHPKMQVLFVSGHVGSEVCRYYGLDVSDSHFLRKPFEAPDLVARVKQVVKANAPFPPLYVPKSYSSSPG